MRKVSFFLSVFILVLVWVLGQDGRNDKQDSDNPEIQLIVPAGFPPVHKPVHDNWPTKYGVELGKKLFNEKKLSGNNTVSCASCHQQDKAFTDAHAQAVGIYGRVGIRNTPPLQNLAFIKHYNWDGNIRKLENQPLVPIITHEEMNSSIVDAMNKIKTDSTYKILFKKAFGNDSITPARIYRSIVQYEYTLVSANSKYDKIQRNEGQAFRIKEARGYQIFKSKCAYCHSGVLFTDQSFRNIGFPLNPDIAEAGRARITGITDDYMRFRTPSLRNIAHTAPYGSFGQFASLKELLDYLDKGVIDAPNLDPILKQNGNRIPLTELEKEQLIDFLHTLSDPEFLGQ